MKLTYPACFYPEDVGGYSVIFPDIPCATQGETLSEAMEMAAEAAAGSLLVSLETGEKLPKASEIKDVELDNPNGFISMVLIDLDNLSKNYSETLVKKTLSIPSWLNVAAEKHNINFSATLKNALIQQLEQ